MKYASALLLFAELLNHLFSQVHFADISHVDTGAIMALLGLVAQSVCDQFARISVKATMTHRD